MHRPQGYHCSRFDTRLLRQIIETDVDTAVRRLRREKGVIIDPAVQRQWACAVLREVEQAVFAERDMHALLPSAVGERIARAIAAQTDADERPPRPPEAGGAPARCRLCRFRAVRQVLIAFRPRFLEKRLE